MLSSLCAHSERYWPFLPNSPITRWTCTSSAKYGQNHKNTSVIRAIFHKCLYITACPYKYRRLGHTASVSLPVCKLVSLSIYQLVGLLACKLFSLRILELASLFLLKIVSIMAETNFTFGPLRSPSFSQSSFIWVSVYIAASQLPASSRQLHYTSVPTWLSLCSDHLPGSHLLYICSECLLSLSLQIVDIVLFGINGHNL